MAKVAQPEPVKQEPVITMWSKGIHLRSVDENEGNSNSYRLFYPGSTYHRTRVVGRAGMQSGIYPAARARGCQRVARNGSSRRQVAATGEICLG